MGNEHQLSTAENAKAFQDADVVNAYAHRPPYPPEVFTILDGLIQGDPRYVLDVGCGPGNIARFLVERVDRLDAVDFSLPMIQAGQSLPNGDHPRLCWLHGAAESTPLDQPYGLVVAGGSLHWMDWQVVLPRFSEVLLPGAYLAIVQAESTPGPWSMLEDIITRYRTDGGYRPFDMLAELERLTLFEPVGEETTDPIPFEQTIEEYIETYHSRSMLARTQLGDA